MRKLTLLLAALLAFPFMISTASAQAPFTKGGYKYYSVRANKTTALSYHAQTNGSCYRYYRTSVVVTHPPRHGDIRVVRRMMRLSSRHPDARCRGKRVRVIKVYYRPDPGYRGRDSFGYQLTGLSTDARTGPRHFSLKVR